MIISTVRVELNEFRQKRFRLIANDEVLWCADIDECWESTDVCGKGSQCQNSIGGYDCMPDEGYMLDYDNAVRGRSI